jgi:hypothetical protein
MKITVDYKDQRSDSDQLRIESAQYLSDFAIKLKFNDGKDRVVNFKSFLFSAIHPAIAKYRDEDRFSKFELIDGNLNWNDYDLIFPIGDLYEGVVDHR